MTLPKISNSELAVNRKVFTRVHTTLITRRECAILKFSSYPQRVLKFLVGSVLQFYVLKEFSHFIIYARRAFIENFCDHEPSKKRENRFPKIRVKNLF